MVLIIEPRRRPKRERAPWERPNSDDDSGACSGGEFDENAFLAGRINVVRKSVERDSATPDNNGELVTTKENI